MATWWTSPTELDKDQKRFVEGEAWQSTILTGPPGSGKTNLLLLRAASLVRTGVESVAFLSFTKTLHDFILTAPQNYRIPDQKVKTYHSWALRLLHENNRDFESPRGTFAEIREAILNALQDYADSINVPPVQFLFLDEGQDYTAQEMDVLRRLCTYMIVAADDRQQIYRNEETLSKLKSLTDEHIELEYHYRNARPIVRVADALLGVVDTPDSLEASAHYDGPPSTIKVIRDGEPASQARSIVPLINEQLRLYEEDPIGILVPKNVDLDVVWAELESSDIKEHIQRRDDDRALDIRRRVVVSTVHSAKGLEFRVVHLLAAETVSSFNKSAKRLAFTAVTRAKTGLYVHHRNPLPSYLEQALREHRQLGARPTAQTLLGGS